jgi:TonB family protein
MSIKKEFAFILFLIPVCLYGQDSIYFDLNWKRVNSHELATYYEVVKQDAGFTIGQEINYFDNNNNELKSFEFAAFYSIRLKELANLNRKVERIYTRNGILRFEKMLIEVSDEKNAKKTVSKLDGKYKEWFDNGLIKTEIDYKFGIINGKIRTYWINGQLKREDNFENGKSVQGKCFNIEGKETGYYLFEVLPEYPGGEKALIDHISKVLKYPVEMQRQRIQGKVTVGFVVKKDGTISDVAIVKGVQAELDEEAVRVVKSLHNFKPGMHDGETV